ncbi:MAG: PadR family transcriptional regulator [Dehalococcoidales bacterium]|nr:PadR family transcriptional regulator [Dehalococcoidales bacterium]
MFAHKFWHGMHGDRMFERGDFKYVILDLIKDAPCHGYEIIRLVEERSHGLYAPSPGMVYPTLQLLEDTGCATATQQEGKKVYSITEQGRKLLAERGGVAKDVMKKRWGHHSHRELHDTMYTLWDIWKILKRHSGRMPPEKIKRVNDILSNARKEIESEMKD